VAAQQSQLQEHLRDSVLANGLHVVVAENPSMPVATVLVAVRSGAVTQEPADEGISHLYEHLLFRSYGGNPSAFGREVASLDGRYNGTTTDEVVNYFVQVPSKRTKDAIKLVARLVQKARFTQGDLNDERPIVLDELQRNESNLQASFARRVDRQLWGDAWSRKDVGGDSTSLAGITLARLREIYARYYLPNNATLVVTGDVSAADVVQAARESFAGWQRGPDPFAEHPIPPIPPPSAPKAVVLGGAVEGVTIRLAWAGPSAVSEPGSTYAADVLVEVLNAPTSAFHKRLVESGLFQSLLGSYQTLAHAGPITFWGQTTPEHAQEALLALLDEVGRLDELEGVTDEDLHFAKQSRVVSEALEFESTAYTAPLLGFWWGTAGLDYFRTYREHMSAQTTDDLRRFVRTYLVGRPFVIGVLGPPAVARQIGAVLHGATSETRRTP
jgi:zinc protease